MSENFKNLRRHSGMSDGSALAQREAAVGAALTLINSKVGNTPDRYSILTEEMDRLSDYADLIQAALKVE
jgi:hypothetical protein